MAQIRQGRARGYTCGGCTNTWTPLTAAHCSICHRTFSSASLFDRHRSGGVCVDPKILRNQAGRIVMRLGDNDIWRDSRDFDAKGIFDA